MTVLALETATETCSVALWRDERVELELTLRRPRAHAENLVPMSRDVLRYAGTEIDALDAVAVSMGPGSYTGLRIGVSTAKGLALASGAQLVGVPTMEALAYAAAPGAGVGDVLVPVLPSRRREVYAACFGPTGDALRTIRDATALAVDDAPGWLDEVEAERFWLFGPGAGRLTEVLAESALPIRHVNVDAPSAASVARLGHRRLEAGQTADLRTFEPFYLKAFVTKKQRSAFEKLAF